MRQNVDRMRSYRTLPPHPKVLICGDRNWDDWAAIHRELLRIKRWHPDARIIHGAARGADSIAGKEAKRLGFRVFVARAEWDKYGRGAGPIRNQKMLDAKPDLVLAFHPCLSESKGTRDMVRRSIKAKVWTRVFAA